MIPLKKEPVDPKELIEWALEGERGQCEHEQIELRVVAKATLPKMDADYEKIAWAVATLVGNALRYVRHGTHNKPGGSILVEIAHANEMVAITVSDDGPGIPRDKLPWLFKRKEGTTHAAGLALHLVHDVVIAHGGLMDVTSQQDGLDHGTQITLRLPIARSST
jgi:signal transduction histidine kinase